MLKKKTYGFPGNKRKVYAAPRSRYPDERPKPGNFKFCRWLCSRRLSYVNPYIKVGNILSYIRMAYLKKIVRFAFIGSVGLLFLFVLELMLAGLVLDLEVPPQLLNSTGHPVAASNASPVFDSGG